MNQLEQYFSRRFAGIDSRQAADAERLLGLLRRDQWEIRQAIALLRQLGWETAQAIDLLWYMESSGLAQRHEGSTILRFVRKAD